MANLYKFRNLGRFREKYRTLTGAAMVVRILGKLALFVFPNFYFYSD
jgi:hypothetical protein